MATGVPTNRQDCRHAVRTRAFYLTGGRAVRVIYFLFLLVFVGAIGLFAYQNNWPETVTLWDRKWETTFPVVVGAAYLLGMLSGWTVVGMLKRSWQKVTEGGRVAV